MLKDIDSLEIMRLVGNTPLYRLDCETGGAELWIKLEGGNPGGSIKDRAAWGMLREAQKRALPYAREVALYLAHGLLHAAGEDDLQPELKRKMRRREKKTMNELEKLFSFEDIFPEPVLTGDNTR